MKKGFKKSLALLLAVFMAFGAAPFCAFGMIAAADDFKLQSLSIGPAGLTSVEARDTVTLSVAGGYKNYADAVEVRTLKNSDVSWTSSNTEAATVSSDGVLTALKPAKEVTITAFAMGDTIVSATLKLEITAEKVKVDTLIWEWPANSFIVDREYSFAGTYRFVPDNPENTDVVLTCNPVGALQIDNEKQTFKVNPIPVGMADANDSMQFTMTLTAKGASATCQPVTKQCRVYSDIPMTSVKWYYTAENAITLFKYYDNNPGIKQKNYHPYKFRLLSGETVLADSQDSATASVIDMCTVTITSSDNRVVRPDKDGKQFIPVGNGRAVITVTVKTPKGTTKSDAVTVVVQDSPYTPITSAKLGYDTDSVVGAISFDKNKQELVMPYSGSIKLVEVLNEGAKLDQQAITVTTGDGRKVNIVSETTCKWKSSDESVATVDQKGNVTCKGYGKATITLTIDDNGTEQVATVSLKCTMAWWQALVGILISIITFNFSKVPYYAKGIFSAF